MAYNFRSANPPNNDPIDDSRSPPNHNAVHTGNDNRGGLTRRFTMNALPTLSPIGQQRRQAAGDMGMVSTQHFFSPGAGKEALGSGRRSSSSNSSAEAGFQDRRFHREQEHTDRASEGMVASIGRNAAANKPPPMVSFLEMLDVRTLQILDEMRPNSKQHRVQSSKATMLTSPTQSAGGYGRSVSCHFATHAQGSLRQTWVSNHCD